MLDKGKRTQCHVFGFHKYFNPGRGVLFSSTLKGIEVRSTTLIERGTIHRLHRTSFLEDNHWEVI